MPVMEPDSTAPYRKWLADMLADSLVSPLPAAIPRRVYGTVSLPGKATAVIGMRRAGKTTFLHQLRRERLERGVPREREVRALDFAAAEHPKASLHLVPLTPESARGIPDEVAGASRGRLAARRRRAAGARDA